MKRPPPPDDSAARAALLEQRERLQALQSAAAERAARARARATERAPTPDASAASETQAARAQEIVKALDEQKQALRDKAAALRSEAPSTDARVLDVTRRQRERSRSARIIGALLVVVLVLLLLLLRQCACDEPPAPPAPVAELVCPEAPECGTGKPKPKATKKPPRRFAGTADKQPRDGLDVDGAPAPPWLGAWRLQVMARSRELAVCFNGVEKPGALRFTATVTPTPGTVTDATLETAVGGPPLSALQEQCVLGVLSNPPYRLTADNGAVGSRVSLVLEF